MLGPVRDLLLRSVGGRGGGEKLAEISMRSRFASASGDKTTKLLSTRAPGPCTLNQKQLVISDAKEASGPYPHLLNQESNKTT